MTENKKKLDGQLYKTTIYALYVFAAALPFSIALTQISLAVALLAWLSRRFLLKSIKFRALSVEWGFAAYIAAEILSLFFSSHFSQNVIFLKRLLLIPTVYLAAFHASDEKIRNRLLWIFVISTTLYSVAGIVSFLINPTLRVRHIQNSMTAGGITMLGALVSAALATFSSDRRKKLYSFVFAAIIAVCLLLTSTRGSWLGFFAGLIVLLFYYNKKLIAVVPVVIVAFYFLAPPEFSARIHRMFDPTWPSNAKRIFWWSVGLEIYKDHPVVGIGDVSTEHMFKAYAPPGTRELAGHMHNNFLHIAVTLGTIGLVAFLYMIVLLFRALFRAAGHSAKKGGISAAAAVAGLAIFFAFNINGLVEWNFGDAEIITIVWFLVGTSLAVMDEESHSVDLV